MTRSTHAMPQMRAFVHTAALLPTLAALAAGAAQAQWVGQLSGTVAEFRSLSAASDNVIWAGGQDGAFARSVNGGATWRGGTVPDAGSLFFIGVHAVSATTAYLLGTDFDGGLARIYKTTDGGARWDTQFSDGTPGVFFDGIAFWDADHGIAFGDPVNGGFMIVTTDNGGTTWTAVPRDVLPTPLEGEAAFAASGTAIAVVPPGHVWIGTGGGATARVLRSDNGGQSWTAVATPLPGGRSAGIFGLAFRDASHGIAVGGDYAAPRTEGDNVLRTSDGGLTWSVVGQAAPGGVRYGVAYVRGPTPGVVAIGPSGTGFSPDEGTTWVALDTIPYNTVAASERFVWVAGPKGQIARAALPLAGRTTRPGGR